MNRSTGKPTKAQAARMEAMHAIGCVACHLDKRLRQCGDTQIHHFLRGGKRIGHDATVPLGSWHHTGIADGTANAQMLAVYGPSFHRHTRAFRERYGTDAELVDKVNEIINAGAMPAKESA